MEFKSSTWLLATLAAILAAALLPANVGADRELLGGGGGGGKGGRGGERGAFPTGVPMPSHVPGNHSHHGWNGTLNGTLPAWNHTKFNETALNRTDCNRTAVNATRDGKGPHRSLRGGGGGDKRGPYVTGVPVPSHEPKNFTDGRFNHTGFNGTDFNRTDCNRTTVNATRDGKGPHRSLRGGGGGDKRGPYVTGVPVPSHEPKNFTDGRFNHTGFNSTDFNRTDCNRTAVNETGRGGPGRGHGVHRSLLGRLLRGSAAVQPVRIHGLGR